MQYKLVYARSCFDWGSFGELEEEVNKMIKKGWKLIGGVTVTQQNGSYTVCQAMVKEDKIEGETETEINKEPTVIHL